MSPKKPQPKPRPEPVRQSYRPHEDTVDMPPHVQKRLRRCGRKFYYVCDETDGNGDRSR